MSDFWKILAIKPTTDVSAIKQAYAALAKKYHPEEFPEKFLKLRTAYESALDYATAAAESFLILSDEEDLDEDTEEQDFEEEKAEQAEQNPFWDFSKLSEKKDVDCSAALAQFCDLYKGKNNKDAKHWYTYFTSYDFLEVWREEIFTKKMYEAIMENRDEFPLNKTFAKCLNAVYGCFVYNPYAFDVVQYSKNAIFNGISYIEKILELCGNLGRMSQNDLSMFISFCEYRILALFGEENQWSDSIKISAEYIFCRYVMAYIRERCERKEYSDVERHYLGIRLMTNIVRKYELPEDMYLYLWKNYALESAVNGRNKLYYGEMREIISQKIQTDTNENRVAVPFQKEKVEKSSVENNKKVYDYYYAYQKSLAEHWDSHVVEDFFSLPETENMLKDRHFIYDTLFYWIAMPHHLDFLERLYDFYAKNPEVFQAKEILSRLKSRKKEVAAENALKEDEADKNTTLCSVNHRPFFRYWLNIGFYRAVDFSDILKQHLTFSEEWAKAFAERKEKLFLLTYRNQSVEIAFHRRYAEYFYGGKTIHRPFLQWYALEELEDDTLFFLLLPAVIPFIDDEETYQRVLNTIRGHFKNTSLPKEIIEQLSKSMVKMLFCGRYILKELDDEDEEFYYDCNEYEFYREDETNLYVCTWSKYSHLLCFYEQKIYERVFMPNGVKDNILTEGEAYSLANELLSAQCAKTVANIYRLRIMPEALYVKPYGGKEEVSLGEEVTEELLVDALDSFARNKIRRLEMKWISEELVLVNTDGQCGCFWFYDGKYTMCKLLSKPDVYCNTDSKYVIHVPFLYGKLATYELFQSPRRLVMKLCPLLFQFGEGQMIDTRVNGGYVWSQNVYLYGKYDAYLVDKMKFGDFPPERVITDMNLKRKLIIPKFPAYIEVIRQNQEKQRIDIKPTTKDQLQMFLQMYLQGNISVLHLCWERKEQEHMVCTHIRLLHENGKYALYYMNDETKKIYGLLSNIGKGEDETTKEESFMENLCGVPVRHNCVHENIIRLRFFLSLLLDSIENPEMLLNMADAFTDGTKLHGQHMTYEEFYGKFLQIQ